MSRVNRDPREEILQKFYNNPAAFAVGLTNLFANDDGSIQTPYAKQIEYMNLIPKDVKVIVVNKARQCLAGNTKLICRINNHIEEITIEKLCKKYQSGEVNFCKIKTINENGKECWDNVLDCFFQGIKKTKKIIFDIGIDLNSVYEKEIKRKYDFILATEDHEFRCHISEGKEQWAKLNELQEKNSWLVTTALFMDGKKKKSYYRVEKIEDSEEQETYDLTTEKYNSYLANGVLVHNCGLSTAFQAKVLHGAYFKKAKQYLIISMNEKLAIEVLDKIRSAYLSMPEELQPGFKIDKRDQLVLENGIKITSLTSNPDAPRSYTKAEIIIDEAAFHQDLEKLWAAAIPVTSQGGSLTIVSTPNGIGNVFHKLCTEDIRTLAGDDPKMQKLWYRMSIPIQDCPHQWEKHEQLRATCFTENQWLQEYMCVFLGDQSERAFDKSFMMMNSFKPWEDQQLSQLEDNEFYNNGIYLYRHSGGSDLPIVGSHVHNMEVLANYESLHAGFDIAMQGKDLSVFTIVGKTKTIQDGETKDCFHVLYSKVWGGELLDNQCEEVMTLCNYFGVKTLCYDKTGGLGQASEESLKKHNTKVRLIPFVFHSKGAKDSISRSQLFINLKIQIAKKLFLQPFKKEIETHFNDVLYDNQSQRFYTKKHDHDDHPVSQALAFYAGYKKQSNSRLGFVGPTSQRLILPGDIRESKNINSEFMTWKAKMDKQWER